MLCACGCGNTIPAKELFRYKPPYVLRGHRLPTPFCACGCGERIPWSPNLRYQKRKGFIQSHDKRKHVTAQSCACGCGKLAAVHKGVARRYISGHNRRSQRRAHSEETKAKIRAARACQSNINGIVPHGMSKTPTYRSWMTMHWRCHDPRDISYPRYGGRGITICERWDRTKGGSFLNFLADMGLRPDGMTLDRIDGKGNYTPDNCRWATRKEQAANRPADNGWIKRREAQQHSS